MAAKCPQESATVIYYSMNSFAPRLSMLKATVAHCMKGDPDQELVLQVLAKLRSLHNARNDLVHSSYGMIHSENKSEVFRVNVRSERAQIYKHVRGQTGEIRNHLQKLGQVSGFLDHYALAHHNREHYDVCIGIARQRAAVLLSTADAISE